MVKTLNRSLQSAKATKQDEFYTQLSDIEKELKHYQKHFKNKTVLCNCDDPRVSNFFKFFLNNCEKLALKKLIATCYQNDKPGKRTASARVPAPGLRHLQLVQLAARPLTAPDRVARPRKRQESHDAAVRCASDAAR